MNDKFVINELGVLIPGKLYTSIYGGENPLYSVKLWKHDNSQGTWEGSKVIKWAKVPPGSVFMFVGMDDNEDFGLMLFEGQVWNLGHNSIASADKIFKRLDDKYTGKQDNDK